MAVANMILNIVTRGDLASLKAGLDMVSQFAGAIKNAMNEVDKFADAHARLSSDVSGVIERTEGLVRGIDAFTNANKLSIAGIKATRDQLGNLAVGATEYAQATGQDIPAAMTQMTEAIIAGSARGLQKFGVDISGAKDKTDAQRMALQQLSDKYAGVSADITSFSNVMSAMSNNLSDATTRMLEASAVSGGFAAIFYDLNKELTTFNTMMEEAPQATADWATDVHNILLSVSADWGNYFATVAEGLLGADNAIAKWLREAAAATNQSVTARNLQRVLESIPEKKQREEQRRQREAAMPAPGRGGRGGGGGKKKSMASMDFSESESEASYQESLDDLIGPDEGRWGGVGGNVDEMAMEAKAQMEKEANTFGPPTTEFEVQKSIDAMNAWIEVRRMQMEEESGFADQFADSWENATSRTSAGAMAAAGMQNLLRGAVTQAANAIVGSSKVTVKAVAEMVKGVALSVGIEATILGLIELGHMIAAIASSWGMSPEVELHAAAVAQYAITAAAAFAVAGAASAVSSASKGSSSASPTGTRTGQGQYGSPGYQDVSGGGGSQNITIVLEGDAEGIFRVVRKENQRQSYSGSGAFAEQAA